MQQSVYSKYTNYGLGFFVNKIFIKNEYICSFTGNIISTSNTNSNYSLNFKDGYVIEPNINELGGHLINHSCNPNSYFGPIINHNSRAIIALRDIKKDEQITAFYGWINLNRNPIKCL